MVVVMEALQGTPILYHQNMMDIRSHIQSHHSSLPLKEQAELLSKAVHSLLEKRLAPLEQSLRHPIKQSLLLKAVKDQSFDLTALDVIQTYAELGIEDSSPVVEWVNTLEDVSLSTQDFEKLLTTLEATNAPITPSVKASSMQPVASTPASVIPAPGETVSLFTLSPLGLEKRWWQQRGLVVGGATAIGIGILCMAFWPTLTKPTPTTELGMITALTPLSNESTETAQNPLHYKDVDKNGLATYLAGRNALLGEEPYLSSMLDVAKEFNVNPLLLFAITGQEQGFVPKSHPKATEIANNPFNVYGSWQKYNTNITESTQIAARTVLNLSEGCPEDVDLVQWINRKYAEDPDWHKGVSALWRQLEKVAGNP